MARFLALDWDHGQLRLAAAEVTRGTVHILKGIALPEEQSPNLAEAETLGRRLAEHLKAAGIAPAPVLACIGRDRVILKEVRYPKVTAAEEPAIVRFQAAKELSEPLEEVVLDYAPVGDSTATGEQRALMVVIRRELLGAYQRLCLAAGLKLQVLAPRPFCVLASLPARSVAGAVPEAQAILMLTERAAELCIARADTLLFARSLTVGAALPGEIRRSLAVYAGQWPQYPLRAFHIADAGERTALCRQLQDLLPIPVQPFDPLAGLAGPDLLPGMRGAFAGVAGLVRAVAQKRPLPINFVAPKEPKPQRDPNRQRLLAGAGIAAAVLLGVVGFGYSEIARKDRELARLQEKKMDLDSQLLLVEEDARRIKALDEWSGTEIAWLDELYELTDQFPDTNSLRLVQVSVQPLAVTGKGKNANKYVARVSLKGITTDDYQLVDTLIGHLVADGHYRVEPKQLKRNTGVERFRFPQEFTTRLDVERRPPTEYVRRIAPAENDGRRGRNRGRDGGADSGFDAFGGGQP